MRCWRESSTRISLRGGLLRASQSGEGRPGPDCVGHASRRRRRVHAESRGSGAGGAGAQESGGVSRESQRDSRQCRQRQLRHTHRRPGRVRHRPRHRESAGRQAGSRFAGIHRCDRRRDGRQQDRRCAPGTGGEARRRAFRHRRGGHLDHRSGTQDRVRRNQGCAHRRHDQRFRHDPAEYGDHSWLRDDRCRSRRLPCCAPP